MPNLIVEQYLARTPRSAAMFDRATASLPGGSTRTTIFNAPYPPYMVRGEGLRTWDLDGNEYRDFLGNYTSLILGHAHPEVVAAVEAQVRRGSAFAAPTEAEIELAEVIRHRLPSIERIRFTNSGTEATMFAIRAARAFTGRPLLAKFEGAYHGTHDTALAGSPGVAAATSELVLELPWGDPEGVERMLAGRERDVAAIIIEPVQGAGGVRAAEPEFLRFLRELCERHEALLIFDEVIAFRVGPNGAQGRLGGVRPDLTTLGKIIGGGYPSGAFGGRTEIMDLFDARRPGAMVHGGTFNGNPVAAAAGLATLRHLTAERYAALEVAGDRLRANLASAFAREGLDARVGGLASIFQVFPGASLVPPDELTPQSALFVGLLVDGFHLAPRGMGALSTVAMDADIDDLAAAILARLGSMQAVTAG
ncbi:MAG TPA: aminotransferase class III-fold pyridoxal phosphate-dependent enzyme [Candidatus Limnocylindria bacterium]|nr:aminotransferase class III-fold pyridoxal phosphate-dependent enzyme [Candidatus Limnocylindria bacterium]